MDNLICVCVLYIIIIIIIIVYAIRGVKLLT